MKSPLITEPENAEKFAGWLRTRGGIAIWEAIDFSRAGQSLSTPATNHDGTPFTKPAYWVDPTPARIITDPADVLISDEIEVERFRVTLRRDDEGYMLSYTDASTRRIRAATEKAGEGAYNKFDYATQEAVIMKPECQLPLLEYLALINRATGEGQMEDILTVDPNMWASMTETEQENYLHELSMTKKTFILDGVKHVYDSNQDPVSWTSGGSSGEPKR
jgi:hypothetical protein